MPEQLGIWDFGARNQYTGFGGVYGYYVLGPLGFRRV